MIKAQVRRMAGAGLAPLLSCYLLAALVPQPGLWTAHLTIPLPGQAMRLQEVLLAAVLFSAGLAVRVRSMTAALRRPRPLLLALGANAGLPVLVVPVLALGLGYWHDRAESEGLAVGLLLMLSMPIAAGAVSWGRQGAADVPLVVAAVLGSTLLSPLTVPLALQLTGTLVGPHGAAVLDDTDQLARLAHAGAGAFALATVLLPCAAGLLLGAALGERRLHTVLPVTKRLSMAVVLTLSYTNASAAFVQLRRHFDPDLLVLDLTVAAVVCGLSFVLGAGCGRLTATPKPRRISLTLATGMSNSSAAAVLASTWFPALPGVLLPILCFSLLQKTAASVVSAAPRP